MRPRFTHRPALLVAASATWAALSLASCAGPGTPQTADRTTLSTQQTAPPTAAGQRTTPGPTAYAGNVTPPATVSTTSVDKDRAVDFLLTWVDVLNYGFATGDADPLRRSTAMGCYTCANWIIDVQTQRDKQLTRDGGRVRIDSAVFRGTTDGLFFFRASLTQDAGSLSDGRGKIVPIPASGPEVVDLAVGISTSSVTGAKSWTMKSIEAPSR
ncbi:DUF6318 family protein [Monashia sp. NPDC004114]